MSPLGCDDRPWARRTWRGAVAVAAAAFFCGSLPASGLAQTSAEPKAAELPRERTKAIERGPPAKPTAPFAVEHTLAAAPALGQPVAVEVVVRALAPVTNIEVRFSVRGELSLVEAPVLTAASLETGEALAGRVVVMPLAAGRSYIGVLAEGDTAGQRQARSVALAVAVAPEEPVSNGEAPPAAPAERREGQAIRSLPADERTR